MFYIIFNNSIEKNQWLSIILINSPFKLLILGQFLLMHHTRLKMTTLSFFLSFLSHPSCPFFLDFKIWNFRTQDFKNI